MLRRVSCIQLLSLRVTSFWAAPSSCCRCCVPSAGAELYAGSLLKALCGNCALTMALNVSTHCSAVLLPLPLSLLPAVHGQ